MAIGVESRGESYGLLIDSVGEVLKLDDAAREPNPINLDQRLARVSAGIHRLDGQLLIVVDVDRVLDISAKCDRGMSVCEARTFGPLNEDNEGVR